MNQNITEQEKQKIFKLCIENQSKACAFAQLIIDYCQIMNCSTYAELKGKSKRAINYRADSLIGVEIENRKFVCLIQ